MAEKSCWRTRLDSSTKGHQMERHPLDQGLIYIHACSKYQPSPENQNIAAASNNTPFQEQGLAANLCISSFPDTATRRQLAPNIISTVHAGILSYPLGSSALPRSEGAAEVA